MPRSYEVDGALTDVVVDRLDTSMCPGRKCHREADPRCWLKKTKTPSDRRVFRQPKGSFEYPREGSNL